MRSRSRWFHSTALTNLPVILAEGLKAGPNAIHPDKHGRYQASVYTEGPKRRHCSFYYATHIAVPGIPPNFWFGVVLKCQGDANRREVKRHQWSYKQGARRIVCAYLHVFDIRRAYDEGYVGSCRVHEKQYLALRAISVPGGRNRYLKDPREYENPRQKNAYDRE